MSRIQITREDFVASFVKVDKSPNKLTTKLEKPPFCHLWSKYVIRPVACDEQPFLIQHKNKQPVIVSQKKTVRRPKAAEVTNFDDDSDEDFEKVVTDKKRAKGTGFGASATVPQAEVNPQFPASDPTKVIVIPQKDKKKEEQPPAKAAIVRNSDAKQKKVEEPTAAPVEPKATEIIKRAEPAQKAKPEAKKSAAKPAAAKAAADSEHAAMMRAMFGGPSPAAEAPTQAPVQQPAAKEAEKAKRPKTAKQPAKKNEGEEQKKEQAKPQAQPKPQSAAPKKDKKGGKQENKKDVVSMEDLLSKEEKQYKQQATLVKKVKEEAKNVDQNDFAAAFGAASQLDQEQDRLKKVGRQARAAKNTK